LFIGMNGDSPCYLVLRRVPSSVMCTLHQKGDRGAIFTMCNALGSDGVAFSPIFPVS